MTKPPRAMLCNYNTFQMFSVVRSLKKGPSDGGALDTTPKSEDSGDLLVSAEEFVRFAGGEYEETEAAQARLRKVLTAAEERGGVTLGDTFGAFDKVSSGRIAGFRRGNGPILFRIRQFSMLH